MQASEMSRGKAEVMQFGFTMLRSARQQAKSVAGCTRRGFFRHLKIFASFSGGGPGSALSHTALRLRQCAAPSSSPQSVSLQTPAFPRAPPAWDPALVQRSASLARAAVCGGDRCEAHSKGSLWHHDKHRFWVLRGWPGG